MYIPLTKILLLLRTKIKIFFKRIPTKIHASNEQERKERIRKIGFIPRWLREYLAFYVSQEDVRRGNADIKPLEFVPVSDGRKLRKEKRPPPPFAPIDFVRRLFRSWAWISEFRIRCCPFEGAEEEEIFDHNSLFLFIFLFPFIGNNLLNLTHIPIPIISSAFLRRLNWEKERERCISISSKKDDNRRYDSRAFPFFSVVRRYSIVRGD